MKIISALMSLCLLAGCALGSGSGPARRHFVALEEVAPDIVSEVRYYGRDNFVGRPIEGYAAPLILLTHEAATALQAVQESLRPYGLGLKVFDAYRPQHAVDHFVRWAEDLGDQLMKPQYYPNVDKTNLFSEGYISARSGHSRGSTVDLTLINSGDGSELDMGAPWDFFDPLSWPDSELPDAQQRANRLLLRSMMLEQGFRPITTEWWHFTLADEPFPDTYFDFPVE